MNEPERPNTTKSFMWLFRGKLNDKPIVICNYDPSRSTSVPMNFLGDFKGILLTDGYPAYNKVAVSKNLLHAGCWAHVRRKFKEAHDASKDPTKSEVASKMLTLIQGLYKIESEIKEEGLLVDDVVKKRKIYSSSSINEIY